MSDVPTPEDSAQVERVLGYCDGWADQWAMENNIADQVGRMFGGQQPELAAHILKWSKQCFGEGCYQGYIEAQAIAKAHFIAPLQVEIDRLTSAPAAARPVTDADVERAAKAIYDLQPFFLDDARQKARAALESFALAPPHKEP